MTRVPPHLRRFIVEQDYGRYSAVDQAVWRFVLLQTHARLVRAAHPAYREGLGATGISPDRIPAIAEMDGALARFGWAAVCVDGFIPPRVFQEFQACGILPIAADIRTPEHLAYTPAPDIIHEAAGHAPILPDVTYSGYLRRIGALGKQAFTLPEEGRVDDAVHALSELREDPGAHPGQVVRAEAELAAATAAVAEPSEAARLARLYWWTAEYGLVGPLDDYRVYGAGLLSSPWECQACHAPTVAKLPLDPRCTEVAYDITRPQPQLYVAPDFEALHGVLDAVERTLAVWIGGATALAHAIASGELASVKLSSGAWVMGVLTEAGPSLSAPAWLTFAGPVAFAWNGRMLPAQEELPRPRTHVLPTGPLADGDALASASPAVIEGCRDRVSNRHRFRFRSGACVEGRLLRSVRAGDGRLVHLELRDARLSLPGCAPVQAGHYVLVAAGEPVTAHAGAVDPRYHPESAFPPTRAPRPRELAARERQLLELFEQGERAHRAGHPRMMQEFARIHAVLVRDHPDEWLLRWNILESLLKWGGGRQLAAVLRAELEELEVRLARRQPIATGLRLLQKRWGRVHARGSRRSPAGTRAR